MTTSRHATVHRVTSETDIAIALTLDGTGKARVETGIGFFDHMLTALAKHGLFDLDITVKGDLHIDGHHTVEDTGIALGQAMRQALGDKRGVRRFGSALVPLDEALCEAVVDLSGRPFLTFEASFDRDRIGELDTELVEEFFRAFAMSAMLTLHLNQRAGKNCHHIAEAAFKALARALRMAVEPDPRALGAIPSTKGVL
ncbi:MULTISPECIES: imidazoleglycerol-phosphate dehydratase HisB [Acetobacter]|jgi:imidazoleglycerol-phosphate dehydratase|uniref:Imidazoleglycerol-phosphate dehydratase n=1 Tax=Acetobacter lovaniensis TaxID=104100 RepID=A0A841QHF9_9PROT|nr:imidazoleglycerol-phosphate dehydratase HisB [Acetobacter lovaniensis]MBB6457848.1 imidazoleglycerol-phosphate dehydratase [Acetobacter lovaniensis]MCI1698269.1 imidazoleglycerol-phosphate dehydratase HisB [Acetobacter lovaniensis]MCI1794924.1 imidazoleglycerol-phosphate dehydratase HisB [Acetobacter lovaniensis]MCP1240044.1 imidazoleglycerol-phosphate dehydratase HisB [Acetobacter lovaniensis]NHN82109.1 imidazoleglycerol-phosphate dehydratase HisB [Acetobacter lovaniensis]